MVKSKSYKILMFFLIVSVTFLCIKPVYAISCDGIFTREAYDFLNQIIDWVRIITPILLIVLCSIDLGQAVISEDKDNLKKATSKSFKRALAAIAIFFVPLIVRVLIDISGIKGTIVDDPECGLEEVGG